MKFIAPILFIGLFMFSFSYSNSNSPISKKLNGKWYTKHLVNGLADTDLMFPEGTEDVYSYFIVFDTKGNFQEDQGCYVNEIKYKLKSDSTLLVYSEGHLNQATTYEILELSKDQLVLHRKGEYEQTISYTREPNGNRVMGG